MELLLVGMGVVIIIGALMFAHVSAQNRELRRSLQYVRESRDEAWDEHQRLSGKIRELTGSLQTVSNKAARLENESTMYRQLLSSAATRLKEESEKIKESCDPSNWDAEYWG